MIPTFLGITIAIFVLCQFVPGGPIEQLPAAARRRGRRVRKVGSRTQLTIPTSNSSNSRSSTASTSLYPSPTRLALADAPAQSRTVVPLQRARSRGDRRPSSGLDLLRPRDRVFTYVICIPLGIVKALRHRTAVDNLSSILIFIGYAVPGFALGAVLANLFAVQFRFSPRRFPVGWRGRHAGDGEIHGHRLAFGVAARCLSRGRVCHYDHADEKQPDGEHERRLCPDGSGQRVELASRGVRACAEEFADPDCDQHRQPLGHFPDGKRADRARVQHPGRRPTCSSRRFRRATSPSSWGSSRSPASS